MSWIRNRGWLDIALWSVGALVLLTAAYLAWSMWSYDRQVYESSPAARAIAQLEEAVRKYPDDVAGRLALAQAYAAGGRLDDARGQYEAVLKARKDNVGAMSGLGLIAMQQKEYGTAKQYWKRIIDLLQQGSYATKDDRLESAYYYLGSTLIEEKRYEDAVANLKEALRVKPTGSDTHYLLAHAFEGMGSTDKYREELRITLALDPKMAEANYDMGVLSLKDGDKASAAEYFRVSADAAPNVDKPQRALDELGAAKEHLARAKADAGRDVRAALDEARIAVALDPSDAVSLRLVAQLFTKVGEREQALVAWQRLLRSLPRDAEATENVRRLSKDAR